MKLVERGLEGPPLDAGELRALLASEIPLLELLHQAHELRRHFFGNHVQIHVLSNARNARCSEDCGYCSQSAVSGAPLQPYEWKPLEQLLAEAHRACALGAFRYCLVASGRGPGPGRIRSLAEAVRAIKREVPVQICVSVGLLDDAGARALEEAGVDRVNHNLNTSERWYPRVCSTHRHADRVETLRAARDAGLEACSGVIVGMGEEDRDLVEVACSLRELGVASIPVNFLIPIEGNRIRGDGSLTPERCLRVLAMFRFASPRADIRAAGGREGHLRALEPLALYPANSLFVDGYLTTRGSGPEETYRMIRDAGFVVERPDGTVIPWEELGLTDGYRVPGADGILRPETLARGG